MPSKEVPSTIFSLRYDATWDWTQVSRTIDKHSTHYFNISTHYNSIWPKERTLSGDTTPDQRNNLQCLICYITKRTKQPTAQWHRDLLATFASFSVSWRANCTRNLSMQYLYYRQIIFYTVSTHKTWKALSSFIIDIFFNISVFKAQAGRKNIIGLNNRDFFGW